MKIPLLIMLIGLCGAIAIQEIRPLEPFTEKITFSFNEGKPTLTANTLRAMSFGYERVFSNLLWLRFLQHTPVTKVPKGEISWIYYDLDAISSIDPNFYPAFEHGGIFLSVITEDKLGAERLLLKGAQLLPDRWRIQAYLAYHYQHELLDQDKAYFHYAEAAKIPGSPPFLGIFASHHVARTQSIQASIRFLDGLKEATKDERMKKNFQDRIVRWRRLLAEEQKR